MAFSDLEAAKIDLSARIAKLPDVAVVTYAACCAERYVGLFSEFSHHTHWGEPARLQDLLENVWRSVWGDRRDVGRLPEQLGILQEQIPQANDFDNLLATLAQDACICVDTAGRCVLGDPHAAVGATIEYSFEALRACVLFEWTGCLDLGDEPRALEMEKRLIKDERIGREISFQTSDIEDTAEIRAGDSVPLHALRERAAAHRWTLDALVPGRKG